MGRCILSPSNCEPEYSVLPAAPYLYFIVNSTLVMSRLDNESSKLAMGLVRIVLLGKSLPTA